jgi:hypothetical protein
MKKMLFVAVALIAMALLVGCKGKYPVAQQTGKEDVAFLLFESADQYEGQTVTVTLDGKTTFQAEVVKTKKAHTHGTQYEVSTGPKDIKVEADGKVLYQKKLMLSAQEVKKITLP